MVISPSNSLFWGYKGVPTKKLCKLLEEICDEYNVDCEVDIQDTHCFDFNAPDAGVHSVLKGGVRNLTRAKCVDHIKRDIEMVVDAMQNNNPRIIQNAFIRAYSRDKDGEVD